MARKLEWNDVLDVLRDADAIPYRVLLWGPPGTGKSTWPTLNHATVYRVALHEEIDPAELVGTWALKDGSTEWCDGPAALAMREGVPLVLDEIDKASGCLSSLLHALLDDPSIAQITLPDGSTVRPREGFQVYATTNADPTTLPDAILDRFRGGLILHCPHPHPQAVDALPKDVRSLVTNFYANMTPPKIESGITYRAVAAFSALRSALGSEDAARAVFGDRGPDVLQSIVASQVQP